jgi:cation-transporting P-type ATPase E
LSSAQTGSCWAPEALLEIDGNLRAAAAREAAAGRRVLALTSAAGPLGIVVLAERLRDSADRTVAFFTAERVALKVLSGDNPATVGAIARDAGIPAQADALDGRALPDTDVALLEAVRAAPPIGRI